jgi:hypothetical protein
MTQSSTLYVGLDVHKDSIAVAYVAQDHGAQETQPRCGVTLVSVKRRQETLVPRARPAPDGPKEGGRHPTDISVINRRVFLAPTLLMHEG